MIEELSNQLTSIGGPVLVALFAASLIATATAIFKIIQFMRVGVGRHDPAHRALAKWNVGEKMEAYDIAASSQAPLSKVAAQAMHTLAHAPGSADLAREHAYHVARELLNYLARYLRILESVVQAAPMLGLLGTVLGMIDAFGELSRGGGAVDPTQLAGGIWVALSTTALGLTIAIPFYFLTNWLESQIEHERVAMEATISAIVFRDEAEKLAVEKGTGTLIGL